MGNNRLRRELAETARGLRELGALDRQAMREFESLWDERSRIVHAPAPILTSSTTLLPNRVLSVVLRPGEDVAWIWTSTSDGGSYVSGYTIIKSDSGLK